MVAAAILVSKCQIVLCVASVHMCTLLIYCGSYLFYSRKGSVPNIYLVMMHLEFVI